MNAAQSYQYTALDRRGQKCRGLARAANEVEAYRQVAAAGLTPVAIRQVRQRLGRARRSMNLRNVAHFTYQLSVLISARIPIGDGLRSIAEQEPPGPFKEVILHITSKIESGSRIADAMAEHRELFGDLYIQTVRVAEETGNLVKVLDYLSEMLERQLETRQQIRSALAYPTCVMVVLLLAVSFLLGFVVPKFASMYEQRGVDLPMLTQVLITIGRSMQAYWYLYVAAIVGGVYALRWASRTPGMRGFVEHQLHRIPFLRQVLIALAVGRFARVLGLCLNSGLSLLDALQMAGRASGRLKMQADAQRMHEQVRTGGRISAVMVACEYLPPFARRMISSGEESGELGRMCGVIARQYERDAAALTRSTATVIEPVLIVLIAGVVLIVALAIFLPMWNLITLLS